MASWGLKQYYQQNNYCFMDIDKPVRFTFTIMNADVDALQRIKDQAPFNGIEVDRSTLIRYAIRKAGNLDDHTVVLATKADVEKVASRPDVMRLIGLVEGLILGRADGRGRPSGVATKQASTRNVRRKWAGEGLPYVS